MALTEAVKEAKIDLEEIDLEFVEAYPNLANKPELVELQLKFFGQMLQIDFTRNYTIAEGHPYCDKVFHDMRFSDMGHPGVDFWDSLDSKVEN